MRDTIEFELKESGVTPEIILAAVRDGVFVIDAKTGAFTYVNDAGCEMFGYSQRELIGRNIGFLSTGIPPYTQDDAIDILKGGRGDAAKGFEWHCKTKGGRFLWGEISLRVVSHGDHQVAGLAIVRDITDRKLSLDLLHESQAALVEAQAVAHVGSWQVDLVGNSVVWSEECYRIFRVDPADFVPTFEYFLAHIHPDDRDALTDMYARTLRDRSHGMLEQRIVLDDGAVRTVEQRWTSFFDADGKPLRTVGTVQDITERKIAESRLKQERDFSTALIDSLPGLFVVFDRFGRFVRCNDYMSTVTGLSIEQLLKTNALELVVESDRDLVGSQILEAFEAGVASVEFGILTKAGDVRTVLWNGRTIMNEGSPQLVAVGLDLTEMREIAERLQTSEERFHAVSQNALDAIIMINDAGEVTYWNPAAERILGYPVSEATGRNVHEWIAPPRFREKAAAGMGRFATTGQGDILGTTQDLAAIRKDGAEIPIELSIAGFRLGANWQAVAFLRDVTVRKRMEQQMAHMAHHDILTGLNNRGVFVDMLNQAIAMSQRGGKLFAVLYLDLDHFKDVNDTLGHQAGDELLQSVARRLLAAVRKSDVVARFGGDEFALIATNLVEPEDAARLADTILQALSVPISIQGSEIRAQASIGIAVNEEDAPDAETLLAHADVALYRAKSEGRGTFRFFTTSMDTEVRARVTLDAELRDALARGQFFLVYQPQINVDTGRVIGVESMVRWRHPRLGVIATAEFIPAAEKSGLIVALGRWVLHEACRQMKEWIDAGIGPPLLGVNLSVLQFKTPTEVENDILAALAEFALPPHLLELELTEGILMEASRRDDIFHRLDEAGVRIAIDDFGSRCSSFSYLGGLPVDRIKIAQKFTAALTANSSAAKIVKASIGLAHDLGLDVIVEGVETEAQLDLIKSWGCHKVQGFYFSKPLPAEETAVFLRANALAR